MGSKNWALASVLWQGQCTRWRDTVSITPASHRPHSIASVIWQQSLVPHSFSFNWPHYYHQTTFWHFFKMFFFLWTINSTNSFGIFSINVVLVQAQWICGHMKEICLCTFTGDLRATFWRNCGKCHRVVTAGATHMQAKMNWIWESQTCTKSRWGKCNTARPLLFYNIANFFDLFGNLLSATHILPCDDWFI